MPGCAGSTRRRRWTGRSARARRRRVPGRCWTGTGSSSARCSWTRPGPRSRQGSCGPSATACWPAPAASRYSWERCRPTASAACGRRTGHAACGWTAAPRCSADVADRARQPDSVRDRSGRTAGGRPAGARQAGADPARRVALDVLLAVDDRDAYANLLLPELIAQRGLAGRDAALATELTYGTLRGRGCYDAVLAICSDRDLAALDPAVREVLRLGTHQLLSTRVAAHAAVATSVTLVRATAGPRPAGFVNAVLRRVATRDLAGWLDIAAPDRTADPAGHLAVRYSHPRWIVEAF